LYLRPIGPNTIGGSESEWSEYIKIKMGQLARKSGGNIHVVYYVSFRLIHLA
jgi:hypothetical protein